jgi:hypothetical protein
VRGDACVGTRVSTFVRGDACVGTQASTIVRFVLCCVHFNVLLVLWREFALLQVKIAEATRSESPQHDRAALVKEHRRISALARANQTKVGTCHSRLLGMAATLAVPSSNAASTLRPISMGL